MQAGRHLGPWAGGDRGVRLRRRTPFEEIYMCIYINGLHLAVRLILLLLTVAFLYNALKTHAAFELLHRGDVTLGATHENTYI